MKPQSNKKHNKPKRNIKRRAKIIYLLNLKGISQKDIASELKISNQAINRVIGGLSKSQKVDTWLKENLGV